MEGIYNHMIYSKMTDSLLVIISSGDEASDKAMTGMLYAINAKKNKWMENVRLIFFGPSEKMVAEAKDDSEIGVFLKQATEVGIVPIACKAISDGENITPMLETRGFSVEYVGSIISGLIKEGYQVLTF